MKRTFSWTLIILCGTTLAITPVLGPGRLWGQRLGTQPALAADTSSFQFALELDGEAVAFFHKCTGLVSASDVYEETVLTAAGLQMDQKRPGSRLLWENIKLTYNVGADDAWLWQWRELVENESWEGALRDGAIVLYGPGGETARWTFTNGWPVRLSVNESVGEITIAHDGLQRTDAEPRVRTR